MGAAVDFIIRSFNDIFAISELCRWSKFKHIISEHKFEITDLVSMILYEIITLGIIEIAMIQKASLLGTSTNEVNSWIIFELGSHFME
jgi:hypothetical protein